MFHLRVIGLLLLLQVSELTLQTLNRDVFLPNLILKLGLELILYSTQASVGPLFLFSDALLQLLFLHVVEVLHLSELLLGPSLQVDDLLFVVLLDFIDLLLQVETVLLSLILILFHQSCLGLFEHLDFLKKVVPGEGDFFIRLLSLVHLGLCLGKCQFVSMLHIPDLGLELFILHIQLLDLRQMLL